MRVRTTDRVKRKRERRNNNNSHLNGLMVVEGGLWEIKQAEVDLKRLPSSSPFKRITWKNVKTIFEQKGKERNEERVKERKGKKKKHI